MTTNKFWDHVDKALDDIDNRASYYVGATLCIDFPDGKMVGLNLNGTGFTRGGKLYLPQDITDKVIKVHKDIRGATEYFKEVTGCS